MKKSIGSKNEPSLLVIALGGEPATGKTTVFNALRTKLGDMKVFSYGLVRGMFDGKGNYVLGVFDGSVHEGTDKLSMAVQPHVVKFLNHLHSKSSRAVVYFEGDRLFNGSLFRSIPVAALKIFVLESGRVPALYMIKQPQQDFTRVRLND